MSKLAFSGGRGARLLGLAILAAVVQTSHAQALSITHGQ
jgi:hypothetical protein